MWVPQSRRPDGEFCSYSLEQYLGRSAAPPPYPPGGLANLSGSTDQPDVDLVVLYDLNLGFRNNHHFWPLVLKTEAGQTPWILLKLASPLAGDNDLLSYIHMWLSPRSILVVSVDDIRSMDIEISRELSWDKTANDLYRALQSSPKLKPLAECAVLIVTFEGIGALLY